VQRPKRAVADGTQIVGGGACPGEQLRARERERDRERERERETEKGAAVVLTTTRSSGSSCGRLERGGTANRRQARELGDGGDASERKSEARAGTKGRVDGGARCTLYRPREGRGKACSQGTEALGC
jgi:hypothetical protein